MDGISDYINCDFTESELTKGDFNGDDTGQEVKSLKLMMILKNYALTLIL
jgi:hypothetical protein